MESDTTAHMLPFSRLPLSDDVQDMRLNIVLTAAVRTVFAHDFTMSERWFHYRQHCAKRKPAGI